ncbi:MAG: hypothetical protein WA364_02030 [Candidatus Nitrosopolaris sp.]
MGREESYGPPFPGKKWELVYTTSTCVTVSRLLYVGLTFELVVWANAICPLIIDVLTTNTLASAAIATSVVKIL